MSSGISGEGVLKKLLEQMNAHVPLRRRRLSELLQMDEPSYTDRNGRELSIDRTELELMKGLLDDCGLSDVKLPIVLIADAGQSQSTWRVEGKSECSLVSAVLGGKGRARSEKLFLYGPHVVELRRRLPTATTCIFVP